MFCKNTKNNNSLSVALYTYQMLDIKWSKDCNESEIIFFS